MGVAAERTGGGGGDTSPKEHGSSFGSERYLSLASLKSFAPYSLSVGTLLSAHVSQVGGSIISEPSEIPQ